MDNKAKKINPLIQKIGLSVLTVLLVAGIVFITYSFTLNKEDSSYINELYKYKIEVDKSNDLVANAVANIDSINIKNLSEVSSIEDKISSASSNLKKVLDEISTLRPQEKYQNQYNSFVNGIALNRKIFIQTNLILKNPRSSNLKSAINDLSTYIVDTSSAYESSKLKRAYIKLPSGILGMTDKINTYAFNVFKDYETRSQTMEQYTSYFSSMDSILSSFNNAKIDLYGNISLINSNTISIDDVYAKIEEKANEISGIQNAYNSLNVPPKMGDIHRQLDDILKAYSYYCQDFKYALNKYEEAQSDQSLMPDVTSTLNDLENKYKTISQNFTNYYNGYNNNKAKYSNINNI